MILRIDQMSPEPVYQQIRDQVVAAIARGELLPADRLPSVRALAGDLGVNLHTVNKAYAALRDEGHLLMRGRSGAVVADYRKTASAERRAADAEELAADLYRLAVEHCARGGSEEAFVDEARAQAARVFADPGAAGARREVGVLGIDADGRRLGATKAAGAPVPAPAPAGAPGAPLGAG